MNVFSKRFFIRSTEIAKKCRCIGLELKCMLIKKIEIGRCQNVFIHFSKLVSAPNIYTYICCTSRIVLTGKVTQPRWRSVVKSKLV